MSRQHTPGPWELWTSNSWRRFMSRDGASVCEPIILRADNHPDLYFRNGGADGPDARLIAAAPDLLDAAIEVEACMSIVEPRSDKAEYLRILGVVREAIAKARGAA